MPIASAFRSLVCFVGIALIALVSPLLRAETTANDGFNPNVTGNVYSVVVQADGKLLVAGAFSGARPNGGANVVLSNIARFLPDGSIDPTFKADTNGQINAMVLQSDGSIIIGGKFTQVGASIRNRVARLSTSGAVDENFDPNVGGSLTPEVTSLAVQADGKILVGGGFMTVQPKGASAAVARSRIARFNQNGTLDETFDPKANGMVLSLAVQADQKILVGGGFSTLSPNGAAVATTRNRIARLYSNGTVDENFNPNADDAVAAIAVQADGRIIIGGSFVRIAPNGGDPQSGHSRLVRLLADGTFDISFLGSADGPVATIKIQDDGRVLVGGSFASVGNGVQNYAVRLLPDGSIDSEFTPGVNAVVNTFAVQPNGAVVLGGAFTTLRGSGNATIVRNHLARVSPSGFLDTEFRPDVNGRLYTMAMQSDGRVLVAGSFTSVGGRTHTGLVRLKAGTGEVDHDFAPSVNGQILAVLQQSNGKILIGGNFDRVNGAFRRYLARLNSDGSLDGSFDSPANDQVTALAQQADTKILVGGAFTAVQPNATTEPVQRFRLARFNENGSLDLSFTTAASSTVNSIIVQSDKKILIAGGFTAIGVGIETPIDRLGLARLNEDGTVDTNFNPSVNGTVRAVAIQSDGKIVIGGSFSQMAQGTTAPVTRNNLGRINADGSLDASFDPNVNGVVTSVLASDNKIYVGGAFTTAQPPGTTSPQTHNYFVRLSSDGKVDDYDLGLDVLPGNMVVALLQPANGKLLIGGAFTEVQPSDSTGARATRLVQITTADGKIDTGFNSELGSAVSGTVQVISTQADGRIIVAGNFPKLGGSEGTNIARFFADSAPDPSFAPLINGTVYSVAQQPSKGAAVPTQHPGIAWLESNGQPRTSFTPPSDLSIGSIRRFAMQDDKIIVGGVGSTSPIDASKKVGSLARLNANGSLDTSFAPIIDGTVLTFAIQADGKILIGGNFTKIGDVARNNLARLDRNGVLDTSFDPNPNGPVESISVQPDEYIVIGGSFNQLGAAGATTTRSGIARLDRDGKVDTGFNPNANGAVTTSAILPEGKIMIGGQFTTLQANGATSTTTRRYVARLNSNGTPDTLDLNPNGPVSLIVRQADDKVILSGLFSAIAGQSRNYLARLNADGGLDADFNPNPNGSVTSISQQSGDNKILISGAFTALEPGTSSYGGNGAIPRSHAARLMLDGAVDPTFNPNFNATVGAIFSATGDSVLAAGTFTTIQPSGSLLVGGSFSAINGLPVSNLALFSGDASISSAFQPNPNGTVYAITPLPNGSAIVGGSFTRIAGATRNGLARFLADDTLDASFNPNVQGDVYSVLIQPDGKLVVGGAFTSVGGVGRSNLVRLNVDGSVDSSFAGSSTGTVRSLALQSDGQILFTNETSASANLLRRLDASGNLDTSFNPSNSERISSIAVQTDGKIVLGGSFKSIGGSTSHLYLARLNPDGSVDETFTSKPSDAVTALSLQADGKVLLAGAFTSVDALPRFGVARIAPKVAGVETLVASPGGTTLTWSRTGSSPEIYGVLFETSSDSVAWTKLGEATRVAGTSSWRLSGLTFPRTTNVFVRARGLTPLSPNASAGVIAAQTQIYLPTGGNDPVTPLAPVLSGATMANGAVGSSFLYSIAASGSPTSYTATGLPAGLSVNASTGLITGTPTQSGSFTVAISATNAGGKATGSITLLIAAAAPPAATTGSLINLSVNAQVTTSSPIIAGFVISGTESKTVLLRAIGPGLGSMGVGSPLAAPRLRLFNGSNVLLMERDGWDGSTDLSNTFTRLGAFPFTVGSTDAAMLVTLVPGAYSVHVTTTSATGGIAVAEIYDASITPASATAGKLVNISARSEVGSGRTVTGGFVITGNTPKRVLVRGLGPRLAAAGVAGALDDPMISLFVPALSAAIATNGDWQTQSTLNPSYPVGTTTEVTTAISKVGASTLTSGSKDAAILVTLPPGVYSAQVTGQTGAAASGAAMVEVYDAD